MNLRSTLTHRIAVYVSGYYSIKLKCTLINLKEFCDYNCGVSLYRLNVVNENN